MVSVEKQRTVGSTLVKVLSAFGAATIVMLVARVITGADVSNSGWVLYAIGGVLTLGTYYFFADRPIWQIETREVVMMAIGAVLYGIFSWATNVLQLPSVSFVSLRPAVVFPAFFGLAFGPVVGFFTGMVGNILGDALTGWGVFPVWDLGNGLMGMVPGLIWAFKDRRKATDRLLVLVGGLLGLITLAAFLFPEVAHPWQEGVTAGNVAPGLLLILIVMVGAVRFGFRDSPDVAASIVWSAMGVIIGMGFASLADIWVNGYTLSVAILGEFLPAAGSNLIFVGLLTPIMLKAWEAARTQTGR